VTCARFAEDGTGGHTACRDADGPTEPLGATVGAADVLG
jgi:hypothetical protein